MVAPNEKEEAIMFRNPVENFRFWDDAEIDVLEHFMMLFAHNHKRSTAWYMDNWVNCEKAVKFLQDHLANKYLPIEKDMSLKKAITEGKVIKTFYTLSDTQMLRLLHVYDSGELYQQLDETTEDYVMRKMKANDIATISMEQYNTLKNTIQEENKGLFNQLKYSHLNIYNTVFDPEKEEKNGYYKYDPLKHGRDCVPSEYAPYF